MRQPNRTIFESDARTSSFVSLGCAAENLVQAALASVAGDLRLETELVRLQQEFTTVPSRVRLTLRAVLIDTTTRRVVATREIDAEATSRTEEPTGGVAANQVVQRVLVQVGAFCADWTAMPK